jgi:flagellar motor switch protein FliM
MPLKRRQWRALLSGRLRSEMAGEQSNVFSVRSLREVLTARKAIESVPPGLLQLVATCAEYTSSNLGTFVPGLRCRGGGIAAARGASNEPNVVAFSITIGDRDGAIYLLIPRKTLFRLSGIVLGGSKDGAYGRLERKLTTLDLSIATSLADIMVASLGAALIASGVIVNLEAPELHEEAISHETHPLLASGFSATIDVILEELSMPVLLLIPVTLIDPPAAAGPYTRRPAAALSASGVENARSNPGVAQTPIALDAVLDACPLTISEVSALQVGDMLGLVAEQASRVRIECDGKPLFWGSLGRQGGAMVVRVDAAIDYEGQQHADIGVHHTARLYDASILAGIDLATRSEGRS